MSKSIHVYLPNQLEEVLEKVLEFDDKFESENTFIRYCMKKVLKEEYYDIFMSVVRNNEKR